MATKPLKLFKVYVNWRSFLNVWRVLRSGQLAEGPEVKKFEREFSDYFKKENVVSLNSGTSALELAYEIAGIGPGDEVITPVLTCTATNLPLIHRKAKIIFADADYNLNINIEDVKRKITNKTKAIVFVHMGGDNSGLREMQKLAKERNIILIEDAAQVLGNDYWGGSDFTAVSLQAIKSLTAGDGGVLICRQKADYEKARRLRWFGYDREEKQKKGDTDLLEAGYKYHMNDISAAIARGNLAVFDHIVAHRNKLMAIYGKLNNQHGIKFTPAVWASKVVDMAHPWKFWKEKLADIAEVGQYHYRNDKYTVFGGRQKFTVMDAIDDHYFFLPMHKAVTEKIAQKIVDRMLGSEQWN